jgi:hypothetical protein
VPGVDRREHACAPLEGRRILQLSSWLPNHLMSSDRTTTQSSSRWLSCLSPAIVGVVAFWTVVGWRALDPTNLAWLMQVDDSRSQYLSWAFFRHAPWTFPLGLNPRFGLELGSSVLYTDSIPLLALTLKPLSAVLQEPFQYFGIWLLACFILQTFFAWVLTGLVTRHPLVRLLSSALFVFAPPMLFRLAGHWALVGHWTILAALVLVLRPSRHRQTVCWTLLTACTALVQPYLLAMVAALWLSAWATDVWLRRRSRSGLAVELAVVTAAVLVVLWQAGFFAIAGNRSKAGFGSFRLNLDSPINAYGWSRVLPALAGSPDDYEGFAFLGLGMLILAALAVPALFAIRARGGLRMRRQWIPLALSVAALTAFAASNRLGFGLHNISLPLPTYLEGVAGTFRSSGRMFWPAFYVLYFAVIAVTIRGHSVAVSSGLLAAALLVQIVDTSAGWRRYEPTLHRRGAITSPLVSGFWYEAPAVYSRVRLVPPGNRSENWSVFAGYAERSNLATDAAYCGRVDQVRGNSLLDRSASMLIDGSFDRDTMYILQNGAAWHVPCVMDSDRDQLALIDGFWVFMPGWKARFGDRYAGQVRLDCPILSPDRAPLAFVDGPEARTTLVDGWFAPESLKTWSASPHSILNLKVEGRVSALELFAMRRPGPALEVDLSVNGRSAGMWHMIDEGPRWYRIAVPDAGDTSRRLLTIGLSVSEEKPMALAIWQARALR